MKLKLEIEFDSTEEMVRVTKAINDSKIVTMEANVTVDHSAPDVTLFDAEDVQEEPSVHVGTETVVEKKPALRDTVVPTKRRRKTKAEPVAKVSSVLDDAGEVLTDEERKANAKAVAAQMEKNVAAASTVEEALTQTPRNFYSLTEFLNNFAVILNNLVKDGTLTVRSLSDYCTQYGVPFIYALSKDKKKSEDFYNQLVAKGHITKKGDY